ncbi:MAG: NADH-quinone oxidoreductase subunit J [Candidatus Omnitrophica bacterium]|nr:NADH-quinone oxidoreductase subunit J [Candidatus Omnitrophota bacterium]
MNHLEPIFFYAFSLIAVLGSAIVVANKRPVYGVLALTVTMLALSALFVLLKAYFVAVIQVLIYAGAILVLFLFVIMLLGMAAVETSQRQRETKKEALFLETIRILKILLPIAFFTELIILTLAAKDAGIGTRNLVGTVEAIGQALFTDYLLPFELVSGILLIGIFGIVTLTQKEEELSLRGGPNGPTK